MDILHADARPLPQIECQTMNDNMMRILDLQEIPLEE